MSVELFLLLALVVVGLGLLVRRQDGRGVREPPARPAVGPPTIQGGRGAVFPGGADDPMLPPPSAARAFSAGAAKVVISSLPGAAILAAAASATPASTARPGAVGSEQTAVDDEANRATGDGDGG